MRRFHVVMVIPYYGMPPQTLHTFRYVPSKKEVDMVLCKYFPIPSPHMYTEKPQIHVVPIDMCVEDLVENSTNSSK